MKKVLLVAMLALVLFGVAGCGSGGSYSSSSRSNSSTDYDGKYQSHEFSGARDVWNSINGK